MHRSLFAAMSVFALLLVSCSLFTPSSNYIDKLVALQCKVWYQCCNAAEREELNVHHNAAQLGFVDEASCRDKMGIYSRNIVEHQTESVDKGRATWLQAEADACLQKIEDAANECDYHNFLVHSLSCPAEIFIEGEVEENGLCFADVDCANGGVCELGTGNDDNEPSGYNPEFVTHKGECMMPPGEGEACGAWCGRYHFCSENTCVPRKEVGAPCENLDRYECRVGRCVSEVCSVEPYSSAQREYDICKGDDQ